MTITNNVVAKLSVAFVTVAMLFTMVAPAQAQSASELQAMIDTLLKQVAALQAQAGGSTSASCTFTRSLTTGSQGADVTCLQNYLISGGYSIPAGATGYFGAQTVAAVSAWQAANGVSPAAGYFGPVSQAKFTAMGGGSTGGNNGGSTGGDLEGNAGSITVDESSEYSSEEVGEDEEDVEVMQFSVEADDDSDVEVTSIKVEFVQGGASASDDFTDYAESVSVWFGGEMVGEADAEDFSESSDVYTKTISLDDSIVRAGEEEDFVIAVTALNNIDSTDLDNDSWTVDVLNVRFVDGDGVSTTEDTDGTSPTLEQTFDFTDFATAADVELKITNGDDEINDAHVIEVDATNDTDNVELFSFMMEAEGDSDITINDLPISATTTEAAGTDIEDFDDVVSVLYLYADGEKIATETPSDSTDDDATMTTFDDIDYTIGAGEEVEFVVMAKVRALDSELDAGDSVRLALDSVARASIDAEDETGEELSVADSTISGTASAEAHTFYATGLAFKLVEADGEITTPGNPQATSSDVATYVFKFELTAFGDDISVDKSCEEAINGGADAADQGIEYFVTASASNATNCSFTSTADTNSADSNAWVVEEGQTETFTLSVAVTASADHFAKVYLESINWDDDTADTDPDLYFTEGLGEDDTSSNEVYLNQF